MVRLHCRRSDLYHSCPLAVRGINFACSSMDFLSVPLGFTLPGELGAERNNTDMIPNRGL
jgi:hypothetical protein